MRSSAFLVVSLIVHFMAVAALILSPQWTFQESQEQEIEMTVGEQPTSSALDKAVSEAPAAPVKAQPAALPAKPVATAKPAVPAKPKASVAALLKREEPKEETTTAAPAEEAPLDPQLDEEDVLVAGAPEAPAPVPVASAPAAPAATAEAEVPANTNNADTGSAGLAHGGATAEGAVSYLGLKQVTGNKAPTYPMSARRERRQGELELVYRVTKEGLVADISVAKSSGHADLDEAAMNAVSKFKFVPGQEGWARHPVTFSLKGPDESLPSKLRTSKQAEIE